LNRVVRYDFASPEWWDKHRGWVLQETLDEPPSPVASNLEGPLLFLWSHSLGRALIVYSTPQEPRVLLFLQATAPTGPWSDSRELLSLGFEGELKDTWVSVCRGQRSDKLVLSTVSIPESSGTGSFPRLFRVSPK
jgi:hypothetical protein